MDRDAIRVNLVRAAHIVRKDIFEKKYDFNGSITNNMRTIRYLHL